MRFFSHLNLLRLKIHLGKLHKFTIDISSETIAYLLSNSFNVTNSINIFML